MANHFNINNYLVPVIEVCTPLHEKSWSQEQNFPRKGTFSLQRLTSFAAGGKEHFGWKAYVLRSIFQKFHGIIQRKGIDNEGR